MGKLSALKTLLTSPTTKKIGKKALGVVTYLPNKAWGLNESIFNAMKIKPNAQLNLAEGIALGSFVTATTGPLITGVAAMQDDGKWMLFGSQLLDTGLAAFAGLILGGPIGAVAAGTSAYVAKKDFVFGLVAKLVKDENYFQTLRNYYKEQDAKKSETTVDDNNEPAPADPAEVAARDTVPATPTDTTEVAARDTVQTEPADETETVDKTKTPDATNPSVSGTKTHIIKKGESLWSIAKKELKAKNPNRTIKNSEIVNEIKNIAKLNKDVFGENPSWKSLDLIYPDRQLVLSA